MANAIVAGNSDKSDESGLSCIELLEQQFGRDRREIKFWWRDGTMRERGSHGAGWDSIYIRDGFKCVYCGQVLNDTPKTLATATEDHLVPQAFFNPLKARSSPQNASQANHAAAQTAEAQVSEIEKQGRRRPSPNTTANLVACCPQCNSVKGSWAPLPNSNGWNSRAEYIAAARDRIREEGPRRYGYLRKWLKYSDKAPTPELDYRADIEKADKHGIQKGPVDWANILERQP